MALQRNILASFLSLLGVASLSFLLGAVVVFFDLPPSSFLRRAFIGGITWHEHKAASTSVEEQSPALTVGQIASAGKTSDGFTLCMFGKGSLAVLIDRHGEMVHQWHVPFSEL